jgi:NAD(P)-dependent dehydrogenase (short-subunit alcohol dehydrogenase family)
MNQVAGEKAVEKVQAISTAGKATGAIFVRADVSKESDVKALVEAAEKTFGLIRRR